MDNLNSVRLFRLLESIDKSLKELVKYRQLPSASNGYIDASPPLIKPNHGYDVV